MHCLASRGTKQHARQAAPGRADAGADAGAAAVASRRRRCRCGAAGAPPQWRRARCCRATSQLTAGPSCSGSGPHQTAGVAGVGRSSQHSSAVVRPAKPHGPCRGCACAGGQGKLAAPRTTRTWHSDSEEALFSWPSAPSSSVLAATALMGRRAAEVGMTCRLSPVPHACAQEAGPAAKFTHCAQARDACDHCMSPIITTHAWLRSRVWPVPSLLSNPCFAAVLLGPTCVNSIASRSSLTRLVGCSGCS